MMWERVGGELCFATLRNEIEDRALPLDRIPDEHLQRLYAYWRERRGDRLMPARADIDPSEMRWLLGRISLIDVTQNPLRFRYRLFGLALVEEFRQDLTGKALHEMQPRFWSAIIHNHFKKVVGTRQPNLYHIVVRHDGLEADYLRLAVPLSNDGREVSMIMTAAVSNRASHH
jgi:hypothetical protein